MNDFQSLFFAAACVAISLFIYRILSSSIVGMFGIFYWSFWLVMIYLSTEGYNKPDIHALTLIFAFVSAFTIFFALGFRSKVGRQPTIGLMRQDLEFWRAWHRHPFFFGRAYKIHLIGALGATILLFYWMFPFLGGFLSGQLERGVFFTRDSSTNPIFNTPLKSFIYFRLITAFFVYIYIYFLLAFVAKRKGSCLLVLASFAFIYSASTLSRSSLSNMLLLFVVFFVLFWSSGQTSVFQQLKVLIRGGRLWLSSEVYLLRLLVWLESLSIVWEVILLVWHFRRLSIQSQTTVCWAMLHSRQI